MGKGGKKKKSNKNTKRVYQSVDEGEDKPTCGHRRGDSNNNKRNSNKNRIEYVFDENDKKLRANLEADNLEIVKMAPDGNCLFRSISDQVFGDYGNAHLDVRSAVCDFIENKKDYFKVFLVEEFELYLESVRQEGEWGGNVEVVAAARLYKRNITVYSQTLAAFRIDHGESRSLGPDLLVSYHDNDHYNSVRRKVRPSTLSRTLADYNPVTMNHDIATQVKQQNNIFIKSDLETSLSKISLKESEEKAINTEKNIKKSSPCPCGSGLRYKKCCLAKQKHLTRIERLKAKNQEEGGISSLHEEQIISSRGVFQIVSI
mmetsp:Transcript_59471/g.66558  ORF Transcript_59471/g.66558 Transcript_59471/m.66558 type:complete len:316 (+) Transcript_59471:529-1476(+)